MKKTYSYLYGDWSDDYQAYWILTLAFLKPSISFTYCLTTIFTPVGDQLSIAKETGRRLGMGTNMYPSSSLFGHDKDENEALPVDELIEKADGFAGVFPGSLNCLMHLLNILS